MVTPDDICWRSRKVKTPLIPTFSQSLIMSSAIISVADVRKEIMDAVRDALVNRVTMLIDRTKCRDDCIDLSSALSTIEIGKALAVEVSTQLKDGDFVKKQSFGHRLEAEGFICRNFESLCKERFLELMISSPDITMNQITRLSLIVGQTVNHFKKDVRMIFLNSVQCRKDKRDITTEV